VAGGARPVAEPATAQTDDGWVVEAQVATFGDTVHTFIGATHIAARGCLDIGPGRRSCRRPRTFGLQRIDHCVANVGWGEMDRWSTTTRRLSTSPS